MRTLTEEQREKKRLCQAAWREKNKDQISQYKSAYRKANAERISEYNSRYNQKNPNREYKAAWSSANHRKFPEKARERTARRKAARLQATPEWADLALISEIYKEAQTKSRLSATPRHVDHIVPLRGLSVCGLHVHNNLQVVPGKLNCSKGNRQWPDMP